MEQNLSHLTKSSSSVVRTARPDEPRPDPTARDAENAAVPASVRPDPDVRPARASRETWRPSPETGIPGVDADSIVGGSVDPPLALGRITLRKVFRRAADAWSDFRCSGSAELTRALLQSKWHSGHDVLKDLFKRVEVRPDDVFADIGCGKGRVVAFLSRTFSANRVIGIELDDEALFAQRIFASRPLVEIRHGDFVEKFPDEATIFYIYPPTDGNLTSKLKAQIDLRAASASSHRPARSITLVAGGALGDLSEFTSDPTWTVEHVAPPDGFLRQLVSTHFVYRHYERGPGYHYGVILRKSADAPRA